MGSGATSNMVNQEENMTNFKDNKTRVVVGDSIWLTATKYVSWHGYQIHDGKLHIMMLSNKSMIPGLYANIFSLLWAPQKGFQVIPEGKVLIINRNPTKICLDAKMTNKSREGYILTTKLYKSKNGAALLAPWKRNPEVK